jgi:ABC-type sugar transport system ATPase subunit
VIEPLRAPEPGPIVELRGVHKSFGGVHALRGVDFAVPAATVIGLAGENGAGKSTLLKIVSGIYSPDSGEVLFDGVAHTAVTPRAAREAGISSVAQELSLFGHLSVAENIFIGQEPLRGWFVDRVKLDALAKMALENIGSRVSPRAMVRDLGFADRQLVEIAKALASNPRVLILDEPTSGLRESEVDGLLQTIRNLRSAGRSIIFITHRISEMFEVCDSFTVLKDGQSVASRRASDTDADDIITLMVGREMSSLFPERPVQDPGRPHQNAERANTPVLAVSNLSVPGTSVREVTLAVHPGEIVGLAGLAGNGQNELLEGIAGIRRARGQITVDGHRGPFSNPRRAIRAGLSLVPEDRKTQGLVLPFSIRQNITLSTLKSVSRYGYIDRKRDHAIAVNTISELAIRPPDPSLRAAALSGGNQQKVVIGKVLQAGPSVFIFADPTRGIDIGTKHEIYVLMRDLAAQGKGILLLSTDLTETIGICDRVLVMSGGRIVEELGGGELTEANVTRASFGGDLVP